MLASAIFTLALIEFEPRPKTSKNSSVEFSGMVFEGGRTVLKTTWSRPALDENPMHYFFLYNQRSTLSEARSNDGSQGDPLISSLT